MNLSTDPDLDFKVIEFLLNSVYCNISDISFRSFIGIPSRIAYLLYLKKTIGYYPNTNINNQYLHNTISDDILNSIEPRIKVVDVNTLDNSVPINNNSLDILELCAILEASIF